MAPKRSAEESLAGPSKRRNVGEAAGPSGRGGHDDEISAAFKAVAGALVPAITELATRTAELGRNDTVLVEDGKSPQLAVDGEGVKERLEREKMLRLREAEQFMAARRDLVEKERAQEELLAQTKLDVMQLVRLVEWPTNQKATKAKGERKNPLWMAASGRGRLLAETGAIWDDWCARRDAAAEGDRGSVLPRSYPEVKAVAVANEKERARAVERRQAAEARQKVAETELHLESAETRRRLPSIPAHPPGQHPEYRRRKGQPKWSKRVAGAPTTEPIPFWAGLGLARPQKAAGPKRPAGKGKGKKRKNW
ncbi:hypothetical protein MMC22_005644 [Lobaria immixta]|nr:hypothetical protein [Lobaria immixta]